jgi:hypothetical protein
MDMKKRSLFLGILAMLALSATSAQAQGITTFQGIRIFHPNTPGQFITFYPPTTISGYTLFWPPVQGAATSLMQNDGNGNLSWITAAALIGNNVWLSTGNSNFNATTNFVGTTNNVDMVFRTNNVERMRITGAGNIGIGASSPSNRLQVAGGTLMIDTSAANTAGQLGFLNPARTQSSTFRAGAQTATINYTWPITQPTANQVLTASSINGTGPYNVTLTWSNASCDDDDDDDDLWKRGDGNYALVGKGQSNDADGNYAITAGQSNDADGNYSVVWGHSNNANGNFSAISGGQSHTINSSADYGVIGGGHNNSVSGSKAVIAGGQSNQATSQYGAITGGFSSIVSGDNAFIGGGHSNNASGSRAVISGGFSNTASNTYAQVGTGQSNQANAQYSTILNGLNNQIGSNAQRSTILNGQSHQITGDNSLVLGGESNTINGNYSMVFGRGASVSQDNTIVFHHPQGSSATRVGIRNNAPSEALEVSGNILSSGTIRANSNILVGNTNNSASELRFLEPSNSGTNYTAFKAGDQSSDITLTLPTTAPVAYSILGVDNNTPTNLSWSRKIIRFTGNTNNVTVTNAVTRDITLPNGVTMSTNSTVAVSPDSDLNDALVVAYARPISTTQIRIKIVNVSAQNVTLPNMSWYVTIMD